jgi:2Fe-2S ferredoxin
MADMPLVTFSNQQKTVEFGTATLPYSRHGRPASVLDLALHFGVPLEHACGGVCACTTCHVWVPQAANNLSAAEDDELDRLDMAADLELCSRLDCQAVFEGHISVEIPPWNGNYASEESGSLNLESASPAGAKYGST